METIDLDGTTGTAPAADEAPLATPLSQDDLAALLGERKPAPERKPARGLTIVGIFVAGLLLGWLAIGWWLWPVHWTNSAPWDMEPEYQAHYVRLVAAEYWHTQDAEQARAALLGWHVESLSRLLTEMESSASSAEARQQLVILRQLLALPDAEPSLWASLGQKSIVLWSAAAAVLVLFVAVALAVGPRVLKAVSGSDRTGKDRDAALQDLLAAQEPWMQEAFTISEEEVGELDLDAPKEEQEQDPESMMRMLIQMDSLIAETDIDLSDGAEDILSDLFGGDETDARVEALKHYVRRVSARTLAQHAQEVLQQIQESGTIALSSPGEAI